MQSKVKLIVATAIALSSPLALAKGKLTDEQYWEKTGMIYAHLTESPYFDTCYKSVQHLKGCLDATNAVAGAAEPALQLIPTSRLGDRAQEVIRVVSESGAFSLVEVQEKAEKKDGSLTEVLREMRLERQKQIAALEKAFADNSKYDFRAELRSLRDRLPKNASLAALAAKGLNAFYAAAVDPHTRISPLQQSEDAMSNVDESFAGVGIVVKQVGDKVFADDTTEGGGAAKAGLKAGDQLLKADDKALTNVQQAVDLLRGKENTIVTVTVLRDGQELRFEITRAKIVVANVETSIKNDLGVPVGYIRLRNFMDRAACEKISGAVKDLTKAGVRGLVLDLRGNGGGLMDQSECIGRIFVGNRVIVKVQSIGDPSGNLQDYGDRTARRRQLETTLPLVTLIDGRSASASEILAGTFQDYARAWLVGERSFGKATVQTCDGMHLPVLPIGGASTPPKGKPPLQACFTTNRFFQPSGRTNQIVGIHPDFEVPIKPDATEDERAFFREEDLPYSLPPVTASWEQPRPEAVARIKGCMGAEKLAEKTYTAQRKPDYQLLKAQEILKCDAQTSRDLF